MSDSHLTTALDLLADHGATARWNHTLYSCGVVTITAPAVLPQPVIDRVCHLIVLPVQWRFPRPQRKPRPRKRRPRVPVRALEAWDLHLERGLNCTQIAAEMGVRREEASRLLSRARKWLGIREEDPEDAFFEDDPFGTSQRRANQIARPAPITDFPMWLRTYTKGKIACHTHTRGHTPDFINSPKATALPCGCRHCGRPRRARISYKGERVTLPEPQVLLTFRQAVVCRLFYLRGINQVGIAKLLKCRLRTVAAIVERVRDIFAEANCQLPRPAHRLTEQQKKLRTCIYFGGWTQPNEDLEYMDSGPVDRHKRSAITSHIRLAQEQDDADDDSFFSDT